MGDTTFNGTLNNGWDEAGNWSAGIPDGSDTATISAGCALQSATVCGAIRIDGVTLLISGYDFTLSGTTGAACLVQNSGVFDASAGTPTVRIGEGYTSDWGLEVNSNGEYTGSSGETYISSFVATNATVFKGNGMTRINGYRDYTTYGRVGVIESACTFTQGDNWEFNIPDTLPMTLKMECTTTNNVDFVGATSGTYIMLDNGAGNAWTHKHSLIFGRGTFDCSGSDLDMGAATAGYYAQMGGARSSAMTDPYVGGDMGSSADSDESSLLLCGSGTQVFGNENYRGVSGSSNYSINIETNGAINLEDCTATFWATPIQGGNGGNSGFWGYYGLNADTATITIKGPTKGWWSSGKYLRGMGSAVWGTSTVIIEGMSGSGSGQFEANNLYNLTLDCSSSTAVVTIGGNKTFTGDLTINGGTFSTRNWADDTDYSLTVSRSTTMDGTGLSQGDSALHLNGSTCLFNSGLTNGGVFLEHNGELIAGADSTVTCGSLAASYDSSITITLAGTNTINSYNSNNKILKLTNGVIDGTTTSFTITTTDSTKKVSCADPDLQDITFSPDSETATTYNLDTGYGGINIGGELTLNAGATVDSNNQAITVGGHTTINGTLTCNTSTVIFGSAGVKSVNGAGTINCDTATITCSDNFGSAGDGLTINMDTASLDIVDRFGDATDVVVVSGVSEPTISCLRFMKTDLTPGHSTVTFDGVGIYGAVGLGAGTFWNVVINTSNGANKEVTSHITIDNDLTITAGGLDTTTDDYDPTILGNFILGSGCEYLTNDSVTTLKGNWINNGGDVG